jgi:simple sugar transport system ATP-binding protein
MISPPRLELIKISKTYPGVIANNNVSLTIMPGEIHALLGENGAGKSTLVKFIYGVQKADSGRLFWEGEQVQITSPKAARKLGIGMVFQHFSLFDAMTVEENIALGISAELTKGDLTGRIRDVSQQYGLPLDPGRYVQTLSVGERQRIEVVRCLLQNPRLLIMDEPTSVLTPQEVEELFKTLRRLSLEGVSILYISHKLDEIRELCHTATVMRAGEVVAECSPENETARSMAEMMMGADLISPQRAGRRTDGAIKLSIANLNMLSPYQHGTDLKDINLHVRAGEVLGVAGIAGNGQRELMEMLTGEILSDDAADIKIDSVDAGRMDSIRRRAAGACFVPEERLGHGAVPDISLWENAFLSAATRMNLLQKGFINVSASIKFAKRVVSEFNVKTPGVAHFATSLSGGNLQKFIVGRELIQDPGVVIVLQPTWGVDAGSAAAIRQALIDLAYEGAAVLAVSQDLEELFEISDRIAVICEGHMSDARNAEDITVEEVGLLMAGISLDEEAAYAG